MAPITRKGHCHVNTSIDQSHEPPTDSQNQGTKVTNELGKKRTRGATQARDIWVINVIPADVDDSGDNCKDDRIVINFNRRGQPIGETRKKYSKFIGTLARNGKLAPLHVRDWRMMPLEKQKTLLSLVKNRSKKNVENRKMKKMNHVTGQRSFADIEEEMTKEKNEVPSRAELFEKCFSKNGVPSGPKVVEALNEMKDRTSCLLEGSKDPHSPNDVFGQVIGERTGGRVLMVGFGVTQSDVWENTVPRQRPSYRNIMQHEEGMTKMQGIVESQANKILQLEAKLARMEKMGHASTSSEISPTQSREHHNTSPEPNRVSMRDGVRSSSYQSFSQNVNSRPLHVGARVSIRSKFDTSKIVATGNVSRLDPNQVVGRQCLGPSWCEVHIQVVIERGEKLLRPYSILKTIEDAYGATIAWPLNLV